MEIFENVQESKNNSVIINVDYKESSILMKAMTEYIKNNKRLKIAKKLYDQMYNDLPIKGA